MRQPHEPTAENRVIVFERASVGVPQLSIASEIGITCPTLRKYYREDFRRGEAVANAAVAKSLWERATSDESPVAAIWWSKARMRWSESKPGPAEALLLKTIKDLRINPASLAEVLRLSGMSPEQRDANREIETRLKSLKEGGT